MICNNCRREITDSTLTKCPYCGSVNLVNIENTSLEVVKDSSVSNFQTFAITAEQLKKIGYKDGSTYLALSVWTNGDTNPGQGGRVHLWLDDISYYKTEA